MSNTFYLSVTHRASSPALDRSTYIPPPERWGNYVLLVKTSDGGSHYFNKIDGKFIDLARDQFDLYGISLDISKAIPVNLTYLGSNPNTQQRYQRLKRNVSSFLRKKDIPITSK